MMTPAERERLLELLTDERLGGLSPEDHGELHALAAKADFEDGLDETIGELLVALDGDDQSESLPADVRSRLIDRGTRIVGDGGQSLGGGSWARRGLLLAASLLLVATVSVSFIVVSNRQRALSDSRAQIVRLEEQITQNNSVIAAARSSVEMLRSQLANSNQTATEAQRALADAQSRQVELAAQLADATNNLENAQLKIARYETPVDPATLQANRRKLLDLPDTVRIAWAPFDLPDAPAEQRTVTGDVVWNDEMQTGYLRFVGLDVNDPNVEQYQVWVIDERGMEQKVSGGVFNATAEGEVIVPIQPGIDVRRVALFAITIEEPGGTWVPDLKRRVVVAPRDG